HNDHLRRIADDGTRPPDMAADRLPQGTAPAGWAIVELRDWSLPSTPQEDASPHLKGKSLQVALTVCEVVRERPCLPPRKGHPRPCCSSGRSKPCQAQPDQVLRSSWEIPAHITGNVGS